ncbi:MAG: aspartate aminotransferase family protein, partial [Myxococcales bacterium]|nr:aspartate aminotransferase family protein [Myxococcales bacterium]
EALVSALSATECPALTARRARRAERSGAAHDPIVWARALGSNVWDADGNRYVDLSAGFGAAALGHAHPAVVEAVQKQVAVLPHALGDLSPSDVKVALLSRLAALGPWAQTRVMLGVGGADAVTAALKSAALHTGKPGVLAFEGGYHGLEYGPLAACGYSEGFRAPFAAQLNPHVTFAPYPGEGEGVDAALASVKRALESDATIGAVLVEPVLGRGGVVVPPAGFIAALARLCRARGVVLICDEVMTGCGRSGAMLASAGDADALPDLICLGKALGGGVAVSACLGSLEVMQAWGDPDGEALHTSTFAGNPLGCAAALATLDVIEAEGLCERSARAGALLRTRLGEAAAAHGGRVRGTGLLVGVELEGEGRALSVARALLERGFITVPAGAQARVVSLTPAFTIDANLLEAFAATLREVLEAGV